LPVQQQLWSGIDLRVHEIGIKTPDDEWRLPMRAIRAAGQRASCALQFYQERPVPLRARAALLLPKQELPSVLLPPPEMPRFRASVAHLWKSRATRSGFASSRTR